MAAKSSVTAIRFAVRAFDAHEWRTLRDLRLRALADAPDAFSRTLAEEEQRPDHEWAKQIELSARSQSQLSLLAEQDGKAVGLAYARLDPEAPETAHLYSMWVAPEARRVGVGLALVEAVIAWARTRGAVRLVLRVTQGNTAAESLYARAGLRFTGETESLRPGSPRQTRTMARDLSR
jgi:ribosomal protein S18 acetylase RimI-like enzyme